jgi:hypothetical protein
MRLHRFFGSLALCLAILLPVQGFAMNLRCAPATQAGGAPSSTHCHEHERGGPLHHDCAPCCGVAADSTIRLAIVQPLAPVKIASTSAVAPPHLARERLDRPPRFS